MDIRHSRGGAIVGALGAVVLLACSGSSPTEVASSEQAPGEPLVVTDAHPPGFNGCPRFWVPDPAPGDFGDLVPLANIVGGAVVEFVPPLDGCTLVIHNGRRTMNVDLVLPGGLWDGEQNHWDHDEACAAGACWQCPVQGPVFAPLLYTTDYRFHVRHDGRLVGRCVAIEPEP